MVPPGGETGPLRSSSTVPSPRGPGRRKCTDAKHAHAAGTRSSRFPTGPVGAWSRPLGPDGTIWLQALTCGDSLSVLLATSRQPALRGIQTIGAPLAPPAVSARQPSGSARTFFEIARPRHRRPPISLHLPLPFGGVLSNRSRASCWPAQVVASSPCARTRGLTSVSCGCVHPPLLIRVEEPHVHSTRRRRDRRSRQSRRDRRLSEPAVTGSPTHDRGAGGAQPPPGPPSRSRPDGVRRDRRGPDPQRGVQRRPTRGAPDRGDGRRELPDPVRRRQRRRHAAGDRPGRGFDPHVGRSRAPRADATSRWSGRCGARGAACHPLALGGGDGRRPAAPSPSWSPSWSPRASASTPRWSWRVDTSRVGPPRVSPRWVVHWSRAARPCSASWSSRATSVGSPTR